MSSLTTQAIDTTEPSVDALAVDAIRFLAADMVESANSGHPGMPMGAAPMAWTLFSRHLRHDPNRPDWPDRDRFVLSAGHGSALQYALLHVFGYDLAEADLRAFRQVGSATPGHPEVGHTPGVEATTGPLGQGIAMAVGMALAERMLAADFPSLVDHRTWAIAGDGCLMEGISHEAASLAGHLRLGKLTVLYDDNRITIDGSTDLSCADDHLARFASYGWHTTRVEDGTDLSAIDRALSDAIADPRPSLIAVRTVIGHGAPRVEGTAAAHGAPLGAEQLSAAKERAGWAGAESFIVPPEVRAYCDQARTSNTRASAAWDEALAALELADRSAAEEWHRRQAGELPDALLTSEFWTELSESLGDGPMASRNASREVLRRLAEVLPELVGGSADLSGSTGTEIGAVAVRRDDYSGRRIDFGIREFGMAAALNGLSLHGGLRGFGSTFLVFSDYLRPALRLSALMRQRVVYVLTHDSVWVGEDGPTHQPVEHLESLRLIPGVVVLRPADARETAEAWRVALSVKGPTVLALSRQALLPLPAGGSRPGFGARDGGRVVRDADAPHLDLFATGSEVALALEAAELLGLEGISVRVWSVMWRERFAERRATLAGSLPPSIAVEAGVTSGWLGFADAVVGVDRFGASGPGAAVAAHVGLTPQAVAEAARVVMASGG